MTDTLPDRDVSEAVDGTRRSGAATAGEHLPTLPLTLPLTLSPARPVPGTLPVDLRPAADGTVSARPTILFAPPHLHRSPPPGPPGDRTGDGASYPAGDHAHRGAGTADAAALAVPGEDGFADLVRTLLADPADGTAATRLARAADASYDFDQYVLLREPSEPRTASYPPQPIPADPGWNRFLSRAESGIGEAVGYALLPFGADAVKLAAAAAALRTALFAWWRRVCAVRVHNRLSRYADADVAALLGQPGATAVGYYASSLGWWLASIAGQRMTDYLGGDTAALDGVFTEPYWETVYADVFAQYFNALRFSDPAAATGAYPFDPVPPDEVIFGLRVVHRQSWRQLAFGRGDLVGTVPLGPRENKKVSVKTTRRTRTNQTTEDSRSFETSAEESTSAKDTTEVVAEATKKVNKHAEAEVSGGYPPFFSAKVSGGISEDVGNSSKQTQSSLNEMMQKTASRMKRDSKVTVSVEGESTFEQTGSSELINPNDEVAITYLYHRLQQRFWVSTQIDEVNSVVLVPEPVPDFDAVDEDWVRAHGEILAGALLEPSFAGTLAAIRTEPVTLAYPATTVFDRSADAGINATAEYRGYTGGGRLPDMLASGQQFYERDYERRAALALDQERRRHQTDALLAHLRRNILHYMRAIWADEDPDQRMQRYARLRVPTTWVFVPRTPVAGGEERLDVDGVFLPGIGDPTPLDEIIDPVGPVGYLFNCAIWRLRDDPKLVNTHQALAHLRAAYTRFAVTVTLAPGSALRVRQTVAVSPRGFAVDYDLVYRSSRGKWLIPVPNRTESDWIELRTLPDGSLDVLGVRVWLDGTPADGETATVAVRVTGELEDPHLILVALRSPLPPAAQEPAFFSDAVLAEMADLFDWLIAAPGQALTWSTLPAPVQALVRENYHRFVMLRDSGRLVTVDSANLLLDLEVGRAAALEPFKRLHRYIDVLKEYEEMRRRRYDNDRRSRLLDLGRLGDPEIERVTVAASPQQLAALVALDDDEPED